MASAGTRLTAGPVTRWLPGLGNRHGRDLLTRDIGSPLTVDEGRTSGFHRIVARSERDPYAVGVRS